MLNVKSWVSNKLWLAKYEKAKKRFDLAIPNRYFMPEDDFNNFVSRYAHLDVKPFQDYSLNAMETRASKRADQLASLVGNKNFTVAEIGAADGLVLKELLVRGARRAVAVDIVDMLHPKSREAGVQLTLTSAEDLSCLEPGAYDLVYSWGSLEHIPNIQKTFHECIKLLKPGGVFYLEAGPLYFSPWGFHYYTTLRTPYIQLLFPEACLYEYARKKHGDGYHVPWTNGRPASEYIALLNNLPHDIEVAGFWYGYDWFSSEFITTYPDIFKSKRINFDDFFIDTVRFTLKRKSCS